MMSNTDLIMKDTCELIKACFEKRELKQISIDKKELIKIAKDGDMEYLLLYPLLKNESDAETANTIKEIVKRDTFLTFAQMMCAKQITELFETEKIRHQLLKGAVLKKIYPSPLMRQMSDVDIVIFDESLTRAARLLEKKGYKNQGLIKHHMIFTSPVGVNVELHWCLFDQNVDYGQYLYFKDTFRSKKSADLNYTYEFCTEDFYIYMIAHMAKHFFETGCGIRNLLDIYVYANEFYDSMDAKYLSIELKKCGLTDFEKNMRKLAYVWMEQKKCSKFQENLFEYMLECGIYGKSKNGVWGQLAKDAKANIEFARIRYYFPSIEFMKEKYSWLEKKSYLLPAAWIVRGISGIISKSGEEHMGVINKADKDEMEKMLEIYCKMNLDFRKNNKKEA